MKTNWLTASFLASALIMPLAPPASAKDEPKVLTNRDPNATDVAKTPINDLNVGRDDEIPPLLLAAEAEPYTLQNLSQCGQLSSAIEALDEILGPDIDLPQEERDRISAGRVGKWVVASFIPFRGLIREVSGANAQDRKVNAAIQAGLTRRGFLKGVGAAKGCRYPASPATQSVIQAHREALARANQKDVENKQEKPKKARRTKSGS